MEVHTLFFTSAIAKNSEQTSVLQNKDMLHGSSSAFSDASLAYWCLGVWLWCSLWQKPKPEWACTAENNSRYFWVPPCLVCLGMGVDGLWPCNPTMCTLPGWLKGWVMIFFHLTGTRLARRLGAATVTVVIGKLGKLMSSVIFMLRDKWCSSPKTL